jgi:peroxiredoxin Q/BCP
LARLRDDYQRFVGRNTEILAVGPNSPIAFEQYWENERMPFVGLPDPDHAVARMYRQEVNLFKMGRMPLSCVIDTRGYVRFAHYGASMSDIPSNDDLFHVIDELKKTSS